MIETISSYHIELSEAQNDFLQCESRGAIFHAGIGSGKSYAGCLWSIMKAMQSQKVCIVSFTYRNLFDVILPLIGEILEKLGLERGKDFDYKAGDATMMIWGGSILLRTGIDPNALRGLNINSFFIDEGREFKDDTLFKVMLGRIRLSENGQWRICSSPSGHNWVWNLSATVPTFTQTTFENAFLPQSFLDEVSARYDGLYGQQELYAKIVEFGSGFINPMFFQLLPLPPIHQKKNKIIRFWDFAVSTKRSACESAGAKLSIEDDRLVIWDIQHGKLAFPDLRKLIIACAQEDGTDCIIGCEEAGQQLGFIDDLKTIPELRQYTIEPAKPRGDPFNRALVWSCRANFITLVQGHWVQYFKDQCSAYGPELQTPDDLIDAVSGGYQVLAVPKAHYHFRTLE